LKVVFLFQVTDILCEKVTKVSEKSLNYSFSFIACFYARKYSCMIYPLRLYDMSIRIYIRLSYFFGSFLCML